MCWIKQSKASLNCNAHLKCWRLRLIFEQHHHYNYFIIRRRQMLNSNVALVNEAAARETLSIHIRLGVECRRLRRQFQWMINCCATFAIRHNLPLTNKRGDRQFASSICLMRPDKICSILVAFFSFDMHVPTIDSDNALTDCFAGIFRIFCFIHWPCYRRSHGIFNANVHRIHISKKKPLERKDIKFLMNNASSTKCIYKITHNI